MRTTVRSLALVLAFALAAAPARAAGLMTALIDTPTAEVVDHYGYNIGFRLYSGGGVLTKTSFGVFPRLNIGFGLDTEDFIGSNTVDLNAPTLNVKCRLYDGKRHLPALALGFDGQGYFFDEALDEYSQRERGLYLVGSGEVLVPHLTLNGGANVYDFSDDRVYAFAGANYLYQEVVGLTFEADNMRVGRLARLNLGVRCFVTPSLSVDVAGRDLWAAGREAERVVLINYFGSF